jgi:hypothetical protein
MTVNFGPTTNLAVTDTNQIGNDAATDVVEASVASYTRLSHRAGDRHGKYWSQGYRVCGDGDGVFGCFENEFEYRAGVSRAVVRRRPQWHDQPVLREAVLGLPDARERLEAIEVDIAGLRAALSGDSDPTSLTETAKCVRVETA